MDKLKTFIINIGQVVAILTMLAPLYIVFNYEKTSDYWFWLIWFILYDIYMYKIIQKIEFIKNSKEHYYKHVKNIDENLNLNISDKERYNGISKFIETFLEEMSK